MAKIAANEPELAAAAKAVLPSVDGTFLTMAANKGLVTETKRRIEVLADGLLDELRKIKPPEEYLKGSAGQAIDDFGKGGEGGGWDPGEAGRRIINNWKKGEELTDEAEEIVDANRKGFERNVENIGIRTSRLLSESVENAFFTGRTLARDSRSFLQDILDWRLHANYTDLTLEAHWRAVYRKTWLLLAQDAGLRFFRQYHPPILTQGEDEGCRANDGKILTYDGWQKVAAKRGTADALDQFGMHYGCRAFWLPIPDATLAEVAVSGGKLGA